MRKVLLAALVASLVAGCAGMESSSVPEGPYVVVLGTAQDGGLPQLGCRQECCEQARRDPERRRMVTSILIADPRTGRRFLVDATPDLPEQAKRAEGHPVTREASGPRAPLFDGIFLTHAHIGHYLGLAHLGREVRGAKGVSVFGSERMLAFLRENGPWSQLVELENVRLEGLVPGRAVALGEQLSITALVVPHREEYTDTLAFVVRGPRRALLYLPDVDKWERWDRRIEDVVAEVDVALLDGTFFDAAELPGRLMEEIPHPFIAESIARFATLPPAERAKIRFTHLNHSNPAADEQGAAAAAVRGAGMEVAREGQVFAL
jgi:pyrroloquinoline quinone biosynthesis protein B